MVSYIRKYCVCHFGFIFILSGQKRYQYRHTKSYVSRPNASESMQRWFETATAGRLPLSSNIVATSNKPQHANIITMVTIHLRHFNSPPRCQMEIGMLRCDNEGWQCYQCTHCSFVGGFSSMAHGAIGVWSPLPAFLGWIQCCIHPRLVIMFCKCRINISLSQTGVGVHICQL